MAHCGTCGVRLPLSCEPNCDCETRPMPAPVAEQPPMGTHGDEYERPSRDDMRYN